MVQTRWMLPNNPRPSPPSGSSARPVGADVDGDGLPVQALDLPDGQGLRDIAGLFMTAPEFAATYGQPDNLSFVQSMYANVLDRPGEAEGVAFWTNSLNAGYADRAGIVLSFSESAEHIAQMAGGAAPAPPPGTFPQPLPDLTGIIFGHLGADNLTGTNGPDRPGSRSARTGRSSPSPGSGVPGPAPAAPRPRQWRASTCSTRS